MAFAFPDGQGNVLGWDQASSAMSLGEVNNMYYADNPCLKGLGKALKEIPRRILMP